MTKLLKCLLSALLLVLILVFSVFSVSAATTTNVENHQLSLHIPDGYVILNSETAEDNAELIESLGYTVESFKNYLKPTDANLVETLFLAIDTGSKAQISVKSWSTEFSEKIGDFSYLDEESLLKTSKELITAEKASYKSVSANGMKLVEVRSNAKDSGGTFGSVQYVTVCNGSFYCINFTFAEKLNDQKVQLAWDTLITLKIGTEAEQNAWDFNSILSMIIMVIATIIAVVIAILIIISIIKDIKKRRTDTYEYPDYIERRK